MHRCPHRETDEPCNAYCRNGLHVDLLYALPEARGHSQEVELAMAQSDHRTRDGCTACEFLAISIAPEAPPIAQRYPQFAQAASSHTLALRLTYRVRQETPHDA